MVLLRANAIPPANSNERGMISKQPSIIKAEATAGIVLCVFVCVSLWSKTNSCSGWAARYAELAATLRGERLLTVAQGRFEVA